MKTFKNEKEGCSRVCEIKKKKKEEAELTATQAAPSVVNLVSIFELL